MGHSGAAEREIGNVVRLTCNCEGRTRGTVNVTDNSVRWTGSDTTCENEREQNEQDGFQDRERLSKRRGLLHRRILERDVNEGQFLRSIYSPIFQFFSSPVLPSSMLLAVYPSLLYPCIPASLHPYIPTSLHAYTPLSFYHLHVGPGENGLCSILKLNLQDSDLCFCLQNAKLGRKIDHTSQSSEVRLSYHTY